MRKILSTTLLLLAFVVAMAVPAKPGIIKVNQPDGTSLSIKLFGDENFNYATTEDGYLIVDTKGQWEYAEWVDMQAVTLGVKANDVTLRTSADAQAINKVGKFSIDANIVNTIRAQRAKATGMNKMQKLGKPLEVDNGLVILVNFSDKRFKAENTRQDFDDLLNKEGYNVGKANGSASDYFEDMSYGTYDPVFHVYGPVTLDKDMAYYGAPNGNSNDAKPAQMVVDAMAKLMGSADSANIDLNIFDADNDGFVDNIFIYYAGNNQAEGGGSNTIWPHKSQLLYGGNQATSTGKLTYKGKTIDVYACTSELSGSSSSDAMCGIGTFCHEFTHVLGLPDVYDTDNKSPGYKLSGAWDIMNSGSYNGNGQCPAGYTAYERFFLNWTKPTVLNTPGNYVLPNINSGDSATFIATYSGQHNMDGAYPNPNIFYTFENRVLEGWDEYLPGPGMIVTRINWNAGIWAANSPNNDPNNLRIDIIEADGDNVNWPNGKAGDAFPGKDNVTSYAPLPQYPLTNITLVNDTISFAFMGGPQKHTVYFSAGDYGTVAEDSLVETEPEAGITLPGVTPDSTYEFVGWSTLRTAHIVDAGGEGDDYFPSKDLTLYAVYTLDGDTVLNNSCFIETFNGLTADPSTQITNTTDQYTDNEGWIGSGLYCDNGAVKVGGSITTPEMGFAGSANIIIRAKSGGRGKINLEVIGGGKLSGTEGKLYSWYEDNHFFLSHCDYTTKLKITSPDGAFYIDSLEVCLTDEVSHEIVESNNLMIINNKMIRGLENNDIVRCIDMNGRIVWAEEANATEMFYTAPKGIYLISVLRNGQIISIKSINL